ncbi:MAG TPA: RNA-guided endonuclease TnpB family protein [bacterium]|nr:RNA-guided endonuclease TnpB family protein [bacterium]
MKILKGFKYKLCPTEEQKQLLLQHGGNARFLWNYLLADNIKHHKQTGKFKFAHEMTVNVPKIKKEYDFLKLSFSQSLQMVARQLDKALEDCFKNGKGFPQFKKKQKENDSFTVPQKWRLGKGFVFIPKTGEVKWIKHRALQGKPKSITISQDGDQWYCSVLCEIEIPDIEKSTDNIVGVDVGLKNFATLSDGTIIENPRNLMKLEEKLKKEQRELSKKQKDSKNRYKQRKKVQKIHRKIRNARLVFLHKTTSNMIAKYSGFVSEDLNIKGTMKNHHLAKSIADVSWYKFKRQLEYKSLWNGEYFLQIGRFEPTSKTCSNCGYVQEMPLSKRNFNCPSCGLSTHRDLNASINILNIGLATLGRRESNACGVGTIVPTTKQEKECPDMTSGQKPRCLRRGASPSRDPVIHKI